MSSNAFLIERAGTDLARREQIVDIVISRMRFSETYFSGVRNRIPRLYDMWRGVWTGRFHPHKNNIHIPLIYSAIWADAARKAATSFGTWPALSFYGYGPDDYQIAKKWENLISAQMKDADLYMKEVDTYVTADLYGVAITQTGWRRDKEIRILEQVQTSPLSGQLIRTIRKGPIVTFDGPDTEPVDRLDAFPQPGVKTLNKMKWFIRRRFIDLDECRILAREGVFDKSELDRMVNEGGVNAALTTDLASIKRFQVRTGMDDESARWMDRYTRPIEIVEMFGYIPSELAHDGDTLRVITVANRRYLMRNRPLPFWHKKLPFVTYSPTPDPHYFDAPGKAEICEKLNIVANRYINQSLDAGDLIADPVIFYDRAAQMNTRNLFFKPGLMIPVDGNPSQVVHPLQHNLDGLAVADQKINQMREYTQMGTAIQEDVVAGMDTGNRQTAREFLGRREAAGTRLTLESRIYEEMYLEPLGNQFIALDDQFLEGPVEVFMLGDNALVDPDTQMPIAGTRTTLDNRELAMRYTARAMGATSSLSKSMKQQNLIQLITAMSATPQIFGSINMLNFWRGIFRDFEIPNVNEIFVQNPQLNALMQQVGAGAPGQVPTSGQIVGGQVPLPGMGGGGEQSAPPGMAGMMAPQQ